MMICSYLISSSIICCIIGNKYSTGISAEVIVMIVFSQLVSQSVSQSFNHSVSQCISQSVNQSVNHSVSQSVDSRDSKNEILFKDDWNHRTERVVQQITKGIESLKGCHIFIKTMCNKYLKNAQVNRFSCNPCRISARASGLMQDSSIATLSPIITSFVSHYSLFHTLQRDGAFIYAVFYIHGGGVMDNTLTYRLRCSNSSGGSIG